MVRRVGRRATSAGLSVALVIAGCGQDCCPRGVEPARSASGRWLLLEGLANARDLGGYPTEDGRSVRWGLLYRSAALNSLTEAGCEGFAGLGIRTVIDLRNRLSPSPLFGGDVPCVHCCSEVILLPVRPTEDGSYVSTFLANQGSYRDGLLVLAEADRLPVLVHCGGGVDRAGIFAAVVLEALGVDREDIIADYLLSRGAADVQERSIVELLEFIDEQGGIEALLASMGIGPDVLTALRNNLLE